MSGKPKRLTKKQIETLPWLHVYSQYSWHQNARIVGTVDGLRALRDIVDRAITHGVASTDVIANDGEGYTMEIHRSSTIEGLGIPLYLINLEMAS